LLDRETALIRERIGVSRDNSLPNDGHCSFSRTKIAPLDTAGMLLYPSTDLWKSGASTQHAERGRAADAGRPIRHRTRFFPRVLNVVRRAQSSALKWIMEPFVGSGVLRAATSGPRLNL